MKNFNVTKINRKPQNIMSLLMLYVLCILLSMSVAMGFCYAYFTAKTDGIGNVKAGILSLQYLDKADGAETTNLVVYNTRDEDTNLLEEDGEVLPGDTLSIRGTVKNDIADADKSTINCYTLLKLEVTKTFAQDGSDISYTDTIWYTLDGTKVTANSSGRYTTEPTLLASGASVDLNIDYVLDGLEMNNSYGAKSVDVTLTLAGYQTTYIEQETYQGSSGAVNLYDSIALQVTHKLIGSEIDVWAEDTVASESLAGVGTEESPYLISSVADLLCFSSNYSGSSYNGKYFKLTKNLDLNNKSWTPMAEFQGNFNGDGFGIYNLNITSATTVGSSKCVGFFAKLTNNTVENLLLKNVKISLSSSDSNQYFIGGIAGTTSQANIKNCGIVGANSSTYDISFSRSSTSGTAYVGGLVGQLSGNTSAEYVIKSCYALVDLSSTNSTTSYLGGLVGECVGYYINTSYFVGNLNASSYTTLNKGLIAGSLTSVNVSNCFAITTASANIVGIGSDLVVNCAYANTSSSTKFTYQGSNCSDIELTTTNIKEMSVLRDALGFSYADWAEDNATTNQGYPIIRATQR